MRGIPGFRFRSIRATPEGPMRARQPGRVASRLPTVISTRYQVTLDLRLFTRSPRRRGRAASPAHRGQAPSVDNQFVLGGRLHRQSAGFSPLRMRVLAISVEKDGNLRVVYARIGHCQGPPAWRGAQAAVARPYPAITCHVGVNGGLYVFEPPAGGHRYTSRAAPAEPEVVKD